MDQDRVARQGFPQRRDFLQQAQARPHLAHQRVGFLDDRHCIVDVLARPPQRIDLAEDFVGVVDEAVARHVEQPAQQPGDRPPGRIVAVFEAVNQVSGDRFRFVRDLELRVFFVDGRHAKHRQHRQHVKQTCILEDVRVSQVDAVGRQRDAPHQLLGAVQVDALPVDRLDEVGIHIPVGSAVPDALHETRVDVRPRLARDLERHADHIAVVVFVEVAQRVPAFEVEIEPGRVQPGDRVHQLQQRIAAQ